MDKFVSWFYSKDFSFWQNVGHLTVILVLVGISAWSMFK